MDSVDKKSLDTEKPLGYRDLDSLSEENGQSFDVTRNTDWMAENYLSDIEEEKDSYGFIPAPRDLKFESAPGRLHAAFAD